MDKYNDTIHTSTNTKPSETFTKLKYEKEINVKKPKFKVGDIVRIYKWKSHFEKGYTKRWTNELFKIVDVIPVNCQACVGQERSKSCTCQRLLD